MEVEEPIALPQTDRRAESSNHGSPRSESTTPSQVSLFVVLCIKYFI